ncbi:hypothetical protein KY361_07290 [Candidatus Woesearchaeota archaeon]|nr:hypothetical protein [Candidatus Woesearchaeota archaeon]
MSLTEDIKIAEVEQRVFWKLDGLRKERADEHLELMNFLHQLCSAAFPYPSLKIEAYNQYTLQQNFPGIEDVPDSDVPLEEAGHYQRPQKEDYERDLEEALDDIRCTSGSYSNYLGFITFIEKVVNHASDYRKVYDGKPEPYRSQVRDFIEEYDFLLEPIPEHFNLFGATRDRTAQAKAAELGIDVSGSTIRLKKTFRYQSPLEISPEAFTERVEGRLFPYLRKFCSDDWGWKPSRKTSCKYGIMRFTYSVPAYFQIRLDIDRERNASLTVLGLKQFVNAATKDLELEANLP